MTLAPFQDTRPPTSSLFTPPLCKAVNLSFRLFLVAANVSWFLHRPTILVGSLLPAQRQPNNIAYTRVAIVPPFLGWEGMV